MADFITQSKTTITSGAASGGAGGSGRVVYPEYMQNLHSGILGDGALTTDITEAIEAVADSSPFDGVAPYDPNADIDKLEEKIREVDERIEADNPERMFKRAIQMGTEALSDGSELVENFKKNTRPSYLQELARFGAAAGDIGAYFTGYFTIGKAQITASYNQDVDNFSAALDKDSAMQLASLYLNLEQNKISKMKLGVDLEQIYITLREAAKNGVIEKKLSYAHKDTIWKLDLYKHAGNFLAAIQGGVTTPGGNVVEETAMDRMNVKLAEAQLAILKLEAVKQQNAMKPAAMRSPYGI